MPSLFGEIFNKDKPSQTDTLERDFQMQEKGTELPLNCYLTRGRDMLYL